MIKFKSCPKCVRGDLVLGRDVYGWYMQCIQCAHIVETAASPAKQEIPEQQAAVLQIAA